LPRPNQKEAAALGHALDDLKMITIARLAAVADTIQ
jgi:hypothetical protein